MELPDNITITRIEASIITGTRPRIIGRNSRRGVHGQIVREPVVRLHTDAGITGWGWSNAKPEDGRRLVGRRLHEVFDLATGTADDFMRFDLPLWDLVGRLLGEPVHTLLGDEGVNPVPVYDGSIYIDELDPETGRDDGVKPMLDAVKMGMAAGFRAFKVKIGRGFQWMEKRAGFKRDVEVLHAIRALIGPEMRLLIDSNNAFTPDEARELMRQAGDCDIFWFEEPFPEDKEQDIAFKRFIQDGGWHTLIADGEGAENREAEITEILRAGGIDVVQFDLRPYPITRWKRYMPIILETGVQVAIHNWGSHLLGFYIPQFAAGQPRFAMGETDIMTMPAVNAEGFQMINGMRSVPDAPGFGLEIDPTVFASARGSDNTWSVENGT